jgi:hypothetical protein
LVFIAVNEHIRVNIYSDWTVWAVTLCEGLKMIQ